MKLEGGTARYRRAISSEEYDGAVEVGGGKSRGLKQDSEEEGDAWGEGGGVVEG